MDKGIVQVFVEQYNLRKGTHYEFECLRRSMFSIPKHKFPALEIYQMAFTEGKKQNPIFADLMVFLRLQKRLIIEVVEPNIGAEDVKDINWSRLVVDIIDPVERQALGEVVCSRHLLIDGRGFGRIRISDPEFYKKNRLERDKMLEEHKQLNKRLGIKDKEDATHRQLSQWIPLGHWFAEIWLLHYNEEGIVRCLQIW
ncbi:MAG TPA: hypothetical protein VMW09_04870 [Desulfatiglandales bacterium]|nr:hypothetical protein [Desulfatiglandales bacterium]